MYDTKEKCRELAEKFKQLCAERGTTPYKIARHSGLSSSTVSCSQNRYHDASLQSAGNLDQRYLR